MKGNPFLVQQSFPICSHLSLITHNGIHEKDSNNSAVGILRYGSMTMSKLLCVMSSKEYTNYLIVCLVSALIYFSSGFSFF